MLVRPSHRDISAQDGERGAEEEMLLTGGPAESSQGGTVLPWTFQQQPEPQTTSRLDSWTKGSPDSHTTGPPHPPTYHKHATEFCVFIYVFILHVFLQMICSIFKNMHTCVTVCRSAFSSRSASIYSSHRWGVWERLVHGPVERGQAAPSKKRADGDRRNDKHRSTNQSSMCSLCMVAWLYSCSLCL